MARFFRTLFLNIKNDEVTRFAASLAFYLSLSFAPILVLFVVVSSTFTFSLQEELQREVLFLVGQNGAEIVRIVIENSKAHPNFSTMAGLVGVITLLISASLIFGELQVAMDRIFGTKHPTISNSSVWMQTFEFAKKRIAQMGIVLSFLFVLMVSLVVSSIIYKIVLPKERTLTFLLNFVLSLIICSSVFTLMIRFLPFKKQPWWGSAKGGFLTAAMFLFGKEFIGIYIGKSAIASVYGAAGSLIAILVWVYYSTMIILVGAELSKLLINRNQHQSTRFKPSDVLT